MKIPANRTDRSYRLHGAEYDEAALRVLRSGYLILGPEVRAFESEFAAFHGDGFFCAGLASGLDALWIGMKLLGIGKGDEVIIHANAYIASVMGITLNDATPVFVEPGDDSQLDPDTLEDAITPRTKAVVAVHLYGQICDMDKVTEICRKHGLLLIEDCAQAHNACWKGRKAGTFGDIGCFSFYPTKNLGAFGDGGAILSRDPDFIEKVKVFRNYGSGKRYYNEMIGANSRLDELQAALLRVGLKYLDETTEMRRRLADRYSSGIDNPLIIKPAEAPGSRAVWHQYVIRCEKRDELIEYLKSRDIGSIIHYPIPPHLQEAYAYLGHKKGDLPFTEKLASTVLSIPFYLGMTDEEQDYVTEALNAFR